MDGGLNNKMYSAVKTESVLGTKKEFRAMIDYLEQEGVIFFLEANPIDIYNNGNGYDNNADTAMSFFGDYAFQYKFIIDSGRPDNATRWHILHPNRIPGLVNRFVDLVFVMLNRVTVPRFLPGPFFPLPRPSFV